MHEAHFSFVICGTHESRWTAYAFDNTEFDGEELYDKIFPCEGVHVDPIMSDDYMDAERPIWNAREYFLHVVESRMHKAAVEWEALLRPVEGRIREYVRFPACVYLKGHFGLLTLFLDKQEFLAYITPPSARTSRILGQDIRLGPTNRTALEPVTGSSFTNYQGL